MRLKDTKLNNTGIDDDDDDLEIDGEKSHSSTGKIWHKPCHESNDKSVQSCRMYDVISLNMNACVQKRKV